jgi:hypothetical protein
MRGVPSQLALRRDEAELLESKRLILGVTNCTMANKAVQDYLLSCAAKYRSRSLIA